MSAGPATRVTALTPSDTLSPPLRALSVGDGPHQTGLTLLCLSDNSGV